MPAEEIEAITRSELQVFIKRASAVVATLGVARESITDKQQLWAFRKRSLVLGLDRLETATIELQKSINAMQMGIPYGPETAKGRPSAKGKSAKTRKKKPSG